MKISIFGNPDLEYDSLPLRILPKLIKRFPKINFVVEDPNELSTLKESPWLILDTVKGLKDVQLLSAEDLKKTARSRVSLHDFDLGMHLSWIKKLNKDAKILIVGIPPQMSLNAAFRDVTRILASLLQGNERRSSYKDRRP